MRLCLLYITGKLHPWNLNVMDLILLWKDTMNWNSFCGKGFILTYISHTYYIINSGKELNVRTWWDDRKKKPMRSPAYWIVPYALLSLFSYANQNHAPRCHINCSELDLPTSIINQNNSSKTFYMPISWRHILS